MATEARVKYLRVDSTHSLCSDVPPPSEKIGRRDLVSSEFIDDVILVFSLITRGLEIMNFIFEWQKQYFTHSLRSFVKYCFANGK